MTHSFPTRRYSDRQRGVESVIADRRTIAAADMRARRLRHRYGRAIVPFILATGVKIDIRLAEHDRHSLGTRRSHGEKFGTEPFGHKNRFGGGTRTDDANAERLVCRLKGDRRARGQRDRTRVVEGTGGEEG